MFDAFDRTIAAAKSDASKASKALDKAILANPTTLSQEVREVLIYQQSTIKRQNLALELLAEGLNLQQNLHENLKNHLTQ